MNIVQIFQNHATIILDEGERPVLFTKLRQMIDTQFIYEGELSETTRVVEDLGADSFDVPVLINSLEDEFGIRITTQEVITIRTIGDLLSLITIKTNNQEVC